MAKEAMESGKFAVQLSKVSKFAKVMPVPSEVIDIVTGFVQLFEEKTNWKNEFKKLFAELMPEALAKQMTGNTAVFLEVVRGRL